MKPALADALGRLTRFTLLPVLLRRCAPPPANGGGAFALLNGFRPTAEIKSQLRPLLGTRTSGANHWDLGDLLTLGRGIGDFGTAGYGFPSWPIRPASVLTACQKFLASVGCLRRRRIRLQPQIRHPGHRSFFGDPMHSSRHTLKLTPFTAYVSLFKYHFDFSEGGNGGEEQECNCKKACPAVCFRPAGQS
uniref:Uncharacterized protein n=1 Tax=Globodera rostochiensis TaxID=31243 RepID=A0A914HLQ1_GLORO